MSQSCRPGRGTEEGLQERKPGSRRQKKNGIARDVGLGCGGVKDNYFCRCPLLTIPENRKQSSSTTQGWTTFFLPDMFSFYLLCKCDAPHLSYGVVESSHPSRDSSISFGYPYRLVPEILPPAVQCGKVAQATLELSGGHPRVPTWILFSKATIS